MAVGEEDAGQVLGPSATPAQVPERPVPCVEQKRGRPGLHVDLRGQSRLAMEHLHLEFPTLPSHPAALLHAWAHPHNGTPSG
ncbi:MAG: hypothetical protein QXY39_05465 [Thermofilaceae archaeon]